MLTWQAYLLRLRPHQQACSLSEASAAQSFSSPTKSGAYESHTSGALVSSSLVGLNMAPANLAVTTMEPKGRTGITLYHVICFVYIKVYNFIHLVYCVISCFLFYLVFGAWAIGQARLHTLLVEFFILPTTIHRVQPGWAMLWWMQSVGWLLSQYLWPVVNLLAT